MTAVRFTALGALTLLLSGCPKPAEVSLTPRPDAEPWFPLGESELTPRYERPIHAGGGRGLVWEQPAATAAARVAPSSLGTALVWAERPGPQPRWRVQLRRWSGEHWLALAPPVYPDPIPDPDADASVTPTVELVVDELERPVMAWAGLPTDEGAVVSVWRLNGPFWKPVGFPFDASALEGLASVPGKQLFLAVRDHDAPDTRVVRWDGEGWQDTAALPGGSGWKLTTDGEDRVWAIGPDEGALEARMWSGDAWIAPAPLATAGTPVDAFALAVNKDGRLHVIQSSNGALYVARGAADGTWTGAPAAGSLTGPLLSAGFDGAMGLVVTEGMNAPDHTHTRGHERVLLHYWPSDDRSQEPWVNAVDTYLPTGDRPALFTAPGGAPALAWAGAPEALESVFTRAWSGETWASLGGTHDVGGGISDTPLPSDRPHLARDPFGRVVAVWVERDLERGESLRLRRFEADGWGPIQDLTGDLLHGDCATGPLAEVTDVLIRFDRSGEPEVNLAATPTCGAPGAWRLVSSRAGWTALAEPFPEVEERLVLDEWDLNDERYLRVKRRDGEVLTDFPPLMIQPVFSEVHAALDHEDRPVVAWVGGVTGSLEVYAVRWDGESWAEMAGSATAGGVSNSEAPSRHPFVLAGEDGYCVSWSEAGPDARQIIMRCHALDRIDAPGFVRRP